jgi:hypothetical protein
MYLNGFIRRLASDDSSLDVTCVANHVSVRNVNPYLIKFAAQDGVPRLVCDLQGLHLRLLVEGDADVAGNFLVLFQVRVEVTRPVPVPEKGDMTEFDRLTALNKKRL